MASLQDYQIPEIQAVKAKYPQYQDTNDITLLNSLVRKFPVYQPIADRVGGEIKDRLSKGDTVDEEKAPVLAQAARWIMGGSELNKMKTAAAEYGFVREHPQYKDETDVDYTTRIDNHMQKREQDLAKQGTVAQFDDVLSLSVGHGLMAAPKLTAKLLAAFATLEGGAQATGVNTSISNINDPNLKDSANLAKFALFGAISGGLANVKGKLPSKPSNHITNDNIHPDVLSNALKTVDQTAPTPEIAATAKKALITTVAQATDKPVAEVIKSLNIKPISSKIETVAKPQATPLEQPGTGGKPAETSAEKQPTGQETQPNAAGQTTLPKDKPVTSLNKDERLALIKSRAQAPYKVTVNTQAGQKELLMPLNKLMDLKDAIKSGESNVEIIDAVRYNLTPPTNATITPTAKVVVSKEPTTKLDSFANPKPTGLATSVEANAVASKLTNGFGNLSEYQSINIPEQAKASSLLVNRDPELAKKIAMGETQAPDGIKNFSVYTAVEAKAIADGDVSTLRDLATKSSLNQESSSAAQTLRLLAERDPESPVTVMKDIRTTREKIARSKNPDLGIKRSNTIAEIKDHITSVKPSKETWVSFIDSIKC